MQNKVTQADREAAADFHKSNSRKMFAENYAEAIRQGLRDSDSMVQAFAAHRIASATAQSEAVQKLVDALEVAIGLLWEHCEGIAPRIEPLERTLAAHRLASTTAQTEAVQKLVEALEGLSEAYVALCKSFGTAHHEVNGSKYQHAQQALVEAIEISCHETEIDTLAELERTLESFLSEREFGNEEPENDAKWREGYLSALDNLREKLKPWKPLGSQLSFSKIEKTRNDAKGDERSVIKTIINQHVMECFHAAGVTAMLPRHPGPAADAILAAIQSNGRPVSHNGRLVEELRRNAEDWRRPNLAQVEGPNDLKIYGGTIANDLDRYADEIERLIEIENSNKVKDNLLREAKQGLHDPDNEQGQFDDLINRIDAVLDGQKNDIA